MNNIDETGMPRYMRPDAYITVKRNAEGEVVAYVGGKPATTYHGQPIYDIEFIKERFEWIQKQNPYIEEFHVGAFATGGFIPGETGNPSSVFGPHAWCRLKFTNGETSSWVFDRTYSSEADCACGCLRSSLFCAYAYEDFLTWLFNVPMEYKQQNNDMPTDAYITVKRNEQGAVGVYVDGKPATTYYGQDIWNIPSIKEEFAWMQKQNPYIEEFHVGAFATGGFRPGETGNPSSVFGPNAWGRVKFKNGDTSSWVFERTYGSAAGCAHYCARNCASYVRANAVFNAPIVPQNQNSKNELPCPRSNVLAQFKQKVYKLIKRLKEQATHTK